MTHRLTRSWLVFVLAGFSLGNTDLGPVLAQPTWLGTNDDFLLALLPADASGAAVGNFPIPNNTAFTNLRLWFEGISGTTLPLEVSPPVGGLVR